jgi:outer membrane protein OmpA-like peptidoglycan-associated protein
LHSCKVLSCKVRLALLQRDKNHANEYVIEAYHLSDPQEKQTALQLCPDHPAAHNNLGLLLENDNQHTAALYHYQQALKIRPHYTEAWVGVGDIYYKQGQWPLSIEAYLQICSEHTRARQRVAELLRDNRYRIADGNVVLTHQSLSLLYDKQRLQQLHQQAVQCRNYDRAIAPKAETLRSILVQVVVFQALHFNIGKHDLSLVSGEQLNQIAITLLNKDTGTILIQGHADSQPFKGKSQAESDYLNWQLSRNRAESVKAALVSRHVPSQRMKTYPYGSSRPLVDGQNETAFAQNRRVEIEMSD